MTTNIPLTVKCPTCQRHVPWNDESLYRPFCSHRCQLIDLGEWASESHKIPADPLHDDLMDDPFEDN